MNNPTWSNLFVTFDAVYATCIGAASYALDTSGDIYYYDNTTSSWTWISGPSSNPIVTISSSTDGTLTALDSAGAAYIYSTGGWANISTSAITVAAADATHYILVNSAGTITKYTSGTGATLSTSGGPTSKISATAGFGQIYGIDGSGNVFQRSASLWASISGKTLQQINVSLSSTSTVQVCGVDYTGNGWIYTTSGWTSVTKPTGVSGFSSLEAGAGYIWATTSSGAVYHGTF